MPTISQIQIGDTAYDIKDAAARSSIADYFKIITFSAPEFWLKYNGYDDIPRDNDRIGIAINLWKGYWAEEWKFIAMLGLSYSARTKSWVENPQEGEINNHFMIKSWGAYSNSALETFWRNWSGQLLYVHSNYRTLWYNSTSGLWKDKEDAASTGLFQVDDNGKLMRNIIYLDEQ